MRNGVGVRTLPGVQPPSASAGPIRYGTRTGRFALLATVLGSAMSMLDGTVVQLALPRIADDLDADFAGLQWVINGYTLALASLILLGGALGDRLGRRRVFSIGVGWFTAASLLCAVAPTTELLVAARVLQGIGGALLVPGSLAIIQASFHPDDRARAIGAWSGLGGAATAIGPFLGGYLVDAASWRWIFLINVPIGIVVLWVSTVHVPETRDARQAGPLDAPGAVLAALGLAGITYGFIEGSWAAGLAGAIAFSTFLVLEARRRHPMLDLSLFRSRQFSATNAVTFVLYGSLGMALFLLGLVLQEAMGYSPLEAGVALLPITLVMLAFSARAGALARRIGPRIPMALGPTTMAAGLLLTTRIEPGRSYAEAVLPALLVFSAGLTLTVAPLTATALASAPERQAGMASGVNNAVARTGQLLAVALIPLIGGFPVGSDVDAATLVDGFHRVALVAALAALAAGATSWTFIRTEALEPSSVTGTEGGDQLGSGDDVHHERGRPTYHCGTDGPPLAPDETPAALED